MNQDVIDDIDNIASALRLQWPSREVWANHQTAGMLQDQINPYHPSGKLSDHASREEIAAAVAALKAQYRDLGRDLRRANIEAGVDPQQKGEDWAQYRRRYDRFNDEQKERLSLIWEAKRRRTVINAVLGGIGDDRAPEGESRLLVGAWPPELVVLVDRYWAAMRAAQQRWHDETLEALTGDAAWQVELERRAEIAEPDNPEFGNLLRAWAWHTLQSSPCVGDFLDVAGERQRINAIVGDRVAAGPPADDDHDYRNPCLHYDRREASFRVGALAGYGAARHALRDIVPTGEIRDGVFWFGSPRFGGIRFTAPCRVFVLKPSEEGGTA